MFVVLFLIISIALIAYTINRLSAKNAEYFGERNLKYVGFLSSIKGIIKIISGRMDVFQLVQQNYYAFPDEP